VLKPISWDKVPIALKREIGKKMEKESKTIQDDSGDAGGCNQYVYGLGITFLVGWINGVYYPDGNGEAFVRVNAGGNLGQGWGNVSVNFYYTDIYNQIYLLSGASLSYAGNTLWNTGSSTIQVAGSLYAVVSYYDGLCSSGGGTQVFGR
jgi:hypothetical protein